MFRVGFLFVYVFVLAFVVAGCSDETGDRRGSNKNGDRKNGDAFLVGIAEVRDGDSLIVGGEEVRLLGIDAPEYDQECGEAGVENGIWRCGEDAKGMLEEMVKGVEVRCAMLFRDVHERWLSRCFIGGRGSRGRGKDLARGMVAGGMVVAMGREYRALMREAQGERRGIWGGCLEKPDKWRKGRRSCWHR